MAKQLYDYWFVQFDFPDENGKPYKSSGGKMVWNEKLKREIPEGWECLRISELENNIVTGKTPSTSNSENFGGEIPFVTIDDIRGNLFVLDSERTLSKKGAESQSNKFLPKGSLCCSCIGTVGIIGFASTEIQTNQQINSIVFSNPIHKEYLYFSLRQYFSVATTKVGNILPNMNKQEFSDIQIIYPAKNVLFDFNAKINPAFTQIEIRTQEILLLVKQRDELLPLLMNGQVRVMPTAVNCDLSDSFDLIIMIFIVKANNNAMSLPFNWRYILINFPQPEEFYAVAGSEAFNAENPNEAHEREFS